MNVIVNTSVIVNRLFGCVVHICSNISPFNEVQDWERDRNLLKVLNYILKVKTSKENNFHVSHPGNYS